MKQPHLNDQAITGMCPVIFDAGERAGEPCTARIKPGLLTCGKHRKYDPYLQSLNSKNIEYAHPKASIQHINIDAHLENLGFSLSKDSNSWHVARQNMLKHGQAIINGFPTLPISNNKPSTPIKRSSSIGKTRKKKIPTRTKEEKPRKKTAADLKVEEANRQIAASKQKSCGSCRTNSFCLIWLDLSQTLQAADYQKTFGIKRLARALGQFCPAFTRK